MSAALSGIVFIRFWPLGSCHITMKPKNKVLFSQKVLLADPTSKATVITETLFQIETDQGGLGRPKELLGSTSLGQSQEMNNQLRSLA